jgi:hypothetical protein
MTRLLALLLLLPAAASAAPVKAIAVALGEPFVLRKEQTALFKGTEASVRVAGFVNSPCPKGARCVWSGQAVNLEYMVAGATVALDAFPLQIKILDSDYKTRAKLKATKRPAA